MEIKPIHNIKKLDEKSFEELFRLYFTPLTYFAKKYINDIETAKEIVHDVFINLWEKRDTIDLNKPVKSYLFTSVNNKCINYIRDNKKFNHNIIELDNINNDSNWESSDKLVECELEDKINTTINSLPEKCRQIFIMNRFDNLKYKEIANKLGISIKTVEAQMSKALKVLRENLIDYITIIILIIYLINK
ncbi:MAG: RNA polymerase sigma-70 factor [Bacteroidales bacterium]|nr:RNA polymerase sigma-70 factor [Bacteroidales bacterium]